MNQMKNTKGITLIALVITIIVLLILAGVAIATLTGENGVLTRASKTKTETEIAEVIEGAKTDVFGEQAGNQGELKKEDFIEILRKYFDDVPTAEELPEDLSTLTLTTKVKYGSHTIKVSDIWNGTFGGKETPVIPEFDENTLTIEEAINTDKYGWKVPEYTVKTEEFTTGVWRLFYQDSNCTYLITDECVGSYKPSDYYSSYTSGADVSIVGQKLSPMISSKFISTNKNLSISAMAWLTDTSDTGMWNGYKNSDAVFAIGTPTIELFAESYNNRSNKSKTINLSTAYYGYRHNTSTNWLLSDENYGIYNKDKSLSFWLASPNGSYEKNGMAVTGGNGCFRYDEVSSKSYPVRPIVCIQTPVFNSNYTLEDV